MNAHDSSTPFDPNILYIFERHNSTQSTGSQICNVPHLPPEVRMTSGNVAPGRSPSTG